MNRTRVALVDDSPDILALWQVMFAHAEGFVVSATFHSADEILDYVTEDPRAVDLILLDLRMPGRSGLDILPELRAAVGERVVIVLVSALDFEMVATDIEEQGVGGLYDLYLTKSTSVVTLVKEVSEYLHHSPLRVQGEDPSPGTNDR